MDYCLMMELKKKIGHRLQSVRKVPQSGLNTWQEHADELEKIFQDAGNALKAEFEEGYSAGYADAWQEIKKVVANAAFDAEMGAAYGEVV